MTLDEWKTLQSGMTIYTKKSGKAREVVGFNIVTLCVKLKPLNKLNMIDQTKPVVYARSDKYLFSLTKLEEERIDDAI